MALGVILASVAGCGAKGPELAPVRGVIRVGGAVAIGGLIQFHSTSGGRTAMGQIQSDGAYQLTTSHPGDGALLGSHRVTIRSTKVSGGQTPTTLEQELARPASGMSKGAKVIWLIDEKYSRNDTTDLKAVVKAGENTIDFELPARSS